MSKLEVTDTIEIKCLKEQANKMSQEYKHIIWKKVFFGKDFSKNVSLKKLQYKTPFFG